MLWHMLSWKSYQLLHTNGREHLIDGVKSRISVSGLNSQLVLRVTKSVVAPEVPEQLEKDFEKRCLERAAVTPNVLKLR